jgi:ribulose-5-phosphate 4-epimerase/fuculose-1-phosphate aldolase
MKYENIRKQVLEAILEAVEQGLIHGTSGNIAMRDPDERNIVAITPSGIPYKGMTPEDIAVVEMKEDGTNEWFDGNFKPSSELPMHTAVMRAREDVNATVHTHSMFATIMAMGDSAELRPITPPQCEFTPVGIVPFTMPGSNDVADKVVATLGENGKAVLIKNHGMFTCGKNMKAAMHATVYTEEMAQTTYYAKVLGTYEPMPEEADLKMKELIAADQAV